MNDIRLIDASVDIVFDNMDTSLEAFEKEFNNIAEHDNDAIGQWLKSARARGETRDSDPVLIHLMMELYRKIDRLENLVLNTTPKRLLLTKSGVMSKIGFEYFELSEPILESSKLYYGRVEFPVLPRRETPFFFEALSPTLAKITRIHLKDEEEWGVYTASRERAMIRHLKGLE